MKNTPLNLAGAALLLLYSASSSATTVHDYTQKIKNHFHFNRPQSGSWYLAGAIGLQKPVVDGRYTVNNGSGQTPPSNVDSYSTHIDPTPIISVDGGYRWKRNTDWIPAYALGLRYAHAFPEDIGRQILQYSQSQFANYNYQWEIYSDIFMLDAKISLFDWRHLLPWLSAGAGVSYNTAAYYKEYAAGGVTPRYSPQYARSTKAQPAWSLGLGLGGH